MAKQGKIIRNGIVYSGGGGGYDIEYLTQAEYDALPESKLTNGVEYRITDSNPPAPEAKDMGYDNSESGLEAETVQDAIDEVQNDVSSLNESLGIIKSYASSINNVTITANKPGTVDIVIPDYKDWIDNGYTGIVITAILFVNSCLSCNRDRVVQSDGKVRIQYDNYASTTSVPSRAIIMWVKSDKILSD